MTRPRPSLGSEQFNMYFDLADLPFLRGYAASWNRVYIANTGVLSTAKALLFAELAASLSRGVPLNEALRLAGDRGDRVPAVSFAQTMRRYLKVATVFAMLLAHLLVIVYLFVAGRFSDPRRVARLMARNFLRGVERGLPLSAAIAAAPTGFTESDVRLIEAAERLGTLPETLREMSTEQRAPMLHALQPNRFYLFYLVVAVCVCIFLVIKIVPKFLDIYQALGAELPAMTTRVIELSSFLHSPHSLLDLLIQLGILVIGVGLAIATLLGPFANGTRLSLQVAAIWLWSGLVVLLLSLTNVMLSRVLATRSGLWMLAGQALVSISIATVVLPYLLGAVQRGVLLAERMLSFFSAPVMRVIAPEVARARRLSAAARWARTMAMALEQRMPESEALVLASLTVGAGFRKRAARLVERVACGVGLRESLARGELFGRELDGALMAAAESPACCRLLAHHAQEMRFAAAASSIRASKALEMLTLLVVSAFLALIIMATFLPLFLTPMLVLSHNT